MPELLDGFDVSIFDGSIQDEKASNAGAAGIDIACHRLGERGL